VGLLHKLLGRDVREREARARDAAAHARTALDAGRLDDALERARAALLESPEDEHLLRVASDALLRAGEREGAALFARAAGGPGDPLRMAELGSHLLSREAPHLACAFLGAALAQSPLDAVVRSELAIAQARSGQPGKAVETLALHPCLADDPGALFEFAWASMLTGDLEAARAARDELAQGRGPRAAARARDERPSARPPRPPAALLDKLDCALARAAISAASDPPDARDYLFLEHGSILLECDGPHRGRHADVTLDPDRAASLLARASAVLRELVPRPRRVVPADEPAEPLARALASAIDGELAPRTESGRLPSCVVVARAADDLAPIADRTHAPSGEILTFALTLDWSRSYPHTPDLVGLLARAAAVAASPPSPISERPPDTALHSFIIARRPHLPLAGRRIHTAYVPDPPLPWV
jgi:hypothetical protein